MLTHDLFLLAKPPARQRQHHPHAQGNGDHRRSAIAEEGQRHALGGEQVDGHTHVDNRLDAELRQHPGHRQYDEQVVFSAHAGQAAQHDKGEKAQDKQAGDDAEFLTGNGEDKIGMRIGKGLLNLALARAAPQQPAIAEGIERAPDLVVVPGRWIEEIIDALGDVREYMIGTQ